MDLFLLLISQIFDAFVENFSLFLIILDILIKFLDLFLEFMLLTRFTIIERFNSSRLVVMAGGSAFKGLG